MLKRIDIINLSHYDVGYTDHPLVCRRLQVRFLDRALELVMENPRRPLERRFFWTCESNNALFDWWQTASPARQDALVEAAQAGWMEICAAPFNHGPTMDAREWSCYARWLPAELRKRLRLRTMVQCDVNGCPRAGVMAMMNAGVEFLWMGLNTDTGGSPLPQPSAFWWEMPDGRRILVMNSVTYPNAYFLFEAAEWRRGPLPPAADTRYRPPESGDFFSASPENLERAHALCRAQIARWRKDGCRLESVAVSMTNMWRIDNDPPCELLAGFIAAWNAAGLQPVLRLTTPARALDDLRREAGGSLPTLTGEWVSWWANGVASTPRELSASRRAKRCLEALESPLYAKPDSGANRSDAWLRDLCFFDEHTWGSWNSVAMPDCLDTRGQFAEKALWAYRPLALAELEIGDANRTLVPAAPGVHVVNPFSAPFTGWVELTGDCLRGRYAGVSDAATGVETRFDALPGPAPFFLVPDNVSQFTFMDKARVFADNIPDKRLRLWVENLGPHQVRSFRLVERVRHPAIAPAGPVIRTDDMGWPAFARWADTILFESPLGDFFSLEFQGPFPRWDYKRVMALPTFDERHRERDQCSIVIMAQPAGPAGARDTGTTLVYEQLLQHPRLGRARRILEVYKHMPRVRLTVSIDRLSKPESAEIFYIRFSLRGQGHDLVVTNGGQPYHPDCGQLPNSCRDFHAIDGRVLFRNGPAGLCLELLDSALVEFGGMHDGLKIPALPPDTGSIYAVIYNNVWYTNFAGDESGIMEFEFDFYATDISAMLFSPRAFVVVRV